MDIFSLSIVYRSWLLTLAVKQSFSRRAFIHSLATDYQISLFCLFIFTHSEVSVKQVTISILSFHCCDFLLRGSGLEEPADRTLLDWPTTDHSSTIFDKKSWIEWYRWKSDGNMYSWEGARTVIYWTLWCIFKIHVSFSRPQEKRDRYRLLQMKTNISHVVWGSSGVTCATNRCIIQ